MLVILMFYSSGGSKVSYASDERFRSICFDIVDDILQSRFIYGCHATKGSTMKRHQENRCILDLVSEFIHF